MRCAQRTRFVAFHVLEVCRHPVIGCAMRPDTTIAMNAVSTEPAHPITLCNRFVDGQDSSVLSCAEVAGSTSWHLKNENLPYPFWGYCQGLQTWESRPHIRHNVPYGVQGIDMSLLW